MGHRGVRERNDCHSDKTYDHDQTQSGHRQRCGCSGVDDLIRGATQFPHQPTRGKQRLARTDRTTRPTTRPGSRGQPATGENSVGCERTGPASQGASGDAGLQGKAAAAIWQIGPDARTLPVLINALDNALDDKEPFVRAPVCLALSKFGPEAKAAVPSLLKAAEDEDPMVKKSALEALRNIDPNSLTPERLKSLQLRAN
ncbi:MAG: hypothetical protein DME24_13910 [Verrucomicrobia bacterium]|nr:MAG: hypothetical protein DME24_13910 [Verrucomicrobiota bacterium]